MMATMGRARTVAAIFRKQLSPVAGGIGVPMAYLAAG